MSLTDWLNPSAAVIGSLANVGSTMATNAYNLQNSREQRAFEQQQWMMQTAYNHPKAQMERLISAGLNPNLAMGDSGNMSNQPAFTGPSQSIPPQVDPMLLSQLELNQAQAENLRADAKLKNAGVDEVKSRIEVNTAKVAEISASVEYKHQLYIYQKLQNDAAFVTDYFEKFYQDSLYKLQKESGYYNSLSEYHRLQGDSLFFGNVIGYLEKMYEITGIFPRITGDVIKQFDSRFGVVTSDDGYIVKEWKSWKPYIEKLEAALKKPKIENEVDAGIVIMNAALSNLYGAEGRLANSQARYVSLSTILEEAANFLDYNPETGEYSISVGGQVYVIGKDASKALGELLNVDLGKKKTTVTRTPQSK